jgi:hypothetical protein
MARARARARSIAAAVAAGLLLAGCSGGSGEEPAADAAPSEVAEPMHEHGTGDYPEPAAPVEWTAKTEEDAERVAVHAVDAFVLKPAEGEEQDPQFTADWWNRLAQYLTDEAQHAYAETDPANVPGTAVTGAPAATPGASDYLAEVVVPTDGGRYQLLLTRAEGPWRVERMTPPQP